MEMTKIKDPAEFLKRLRKENNLSQKDLAKEIDVAPSYLSLIEQGKTPGKPVLNKISEKFSIDVSSLLPERTKKKSKTKVSEENESPKVTVLQKEEKNGIKPEVRVVVNLDEKKQQKEQLKESLKLDLDTIKDASDLFKQIRKAKDLRILELAEIMGSSSSQISQIESGKKVAGRNIIKKLADALQLSEEKCLEIAGFSKEEKAPAKRQYKTKLKEMSQAIEEVTLIEEKAVETSAIEENLQLEEKQELLSTVLEIKNSNASLEQEKAEFNKLVQEQTTEPVDEHNAASQATDINPDFLESEPIKMHLIAKGEFSLRSGKKHYADINNDYMYEFKLGIDGLKGKEVLLTFKNTTMSIELSDVAN